MSSSVNPTDVITEVTVRQKYNRLTESLSNNNVHVSESKIRRYIKQSLCLQYGQVPDSFRTG